MQWTSWQCWGMVLQFLLASHLTAAEPTVSLATGEWSPYTSASLENQGFFTEIVVAAFKAVNLEPKLQFVPWKRCELLATTGKVFAMFPYAPTPERERDYIFSDPVVHARSKFFYYKPRYKGPADFDKDKLEELRHLRIGGAVGHWYEKLFTEKKLKVDYAENEVSGLKKLILGRIDLLPMDLVIGQELIGKQFPKERDKIGTLNTTLFEGPLHLLTSRTFKDGEKMMKKFNEGLANIKRSGEFDRIQKKFGL